MKRLLGLLCALLFSVPAMAAETLCNLWDVSSATEQTLKGVRYHPNADGTITVSGTSEGYAAYQLPVFTVPESLQGKTITIGNMSEAQGIAWSGIVLKDANNQELGNIPEAQNTSIAYATITLDPNVKYIEAGIKRKTDGVLISDVFKPIIVEGSVATAYIPYNASCGVGCNLFNKDDSHMILNGYIDASLVRIGTQYDGYRSAIIKVNPNTTYTIQRYIGEPSNIHNRMRIGDTTSFPQVEGPVQNVEFYDNSTTRTATHKTSANAQYMIVYGMNNSASSTDRANFFNALKIEEGSTATDYVAYSAGCRPNCRAYASATGTVSQSPAPTPSAPVTPTFYQQGNIVLRKVGSYADSYDASTGIITRRVGVVVFNGTENWNNYTQGNSVYTDVSARKNISEGLSSHYKIDTRNGVDNSIWPSTGSNSIIFTDSQHATSAGAFKTWLSQNPVTFYYPLKTEITEYVGMEWCEGIKIATTKYNTNAFSSVVTALNNAVDTIKTVVANTINQATAVANLQSGKQTMPNSTATNGTCPNYKQCLLVEDNNGTPHWYVITDPFRDYVTPILANNTAPATATGNAGFQQLDYIEKTTGSQYIDTGFVLNSQDVQYNIELEFTRTPGSSACLFGAEAATSGGYSGLWYFGGTGSAGLFAGNSSFMTYQTLTAGHKYNLITKVKNNIAEVYVDGTQTFRGGYSGTLSSNPIYLIGLYDASREQPMYNAQTGYIKIYKFQIIEQNELKFNGIPVRRLSDNKIGLYDTVSETFRGNAADSGTFIAGSNVTNDANVPTSINWTANWTASGSVVAGTVYGVGLCNNVTGGTTNSVATAAQLASTAWDTAGESCWCKANGLVVNGDYYSVNNTPWVLRAVSGGYSTNCASACDSVCTYYMLNNQTFRQRILTVQ